MRDIAAFYRPGAFLAHAQWTPDELKHGVPGGRRFAEFWYVWAVTLHEWCHHLQIVGTSFGNEYLELTMMSGAIISSTLKRILQSHPAATMSRPLVNHFLRLSDNKALAVRGVGCAVNSEILLGMLDDAKLLYGDWPCPRNTPNPTVRVGSTAHRIGALQVIEGHALRNEEIYITRYSGLPDSVRRDIKEVLNAPAFFDPYGVAYAYLSQELPGMTEEARSDLFCLCCDVALNPPSIISIRDADTGLVWEDYHPGWRFVRIVAHLKRDVDCRHVAEQDRLAALAVALHTAFNWPRDTYQSTLSGPLLSPFMGRVRDIRTSEPLGLALPAVFFGSVQQRFPVSFGRYNAPKDARRSFTELPGSGTTQFEEARRVGAIFEHTTHEMLKERQLTCPWHGTVMPPSTVCIDGCPFAGLFKALFGISVEEYCDIPVEQEQ